MRKIGLIVFCCILSACSTSKTKKVEPTESLQESTPKILQKKTEAPPSTQAPEEKSIKSIICKSGSDERKISISQPKAGGCEVHYTKFGKSSSVATALSDPGHCMKVLENIKGKLEKADFECK